MSHRQELRLNSSDEIIDLTGDSPITNRPRMRASRTRNFPTQLLRTNLASRNSQQEEELPVPVTLSESIRSVDSDMSAIQVLDADEIPLIIRSLQDEQQKRSLNATKSKKEYSAAVPCVIDPCNGEQIVLSCPICFEPLVAERKPMATICGHIFCAMCLKQTLQETRNKTCPKCNGAVKLKSCIRLYL